MEEREYIIFCDESDSSGAVYSNFYGGIVVRGSQIQRIESELRDFSASLGLHEEIKWNKVNQLYLKSYSALISKFFEEVKAGNIKVRIMFRENRFVIKNLTKEQRENGYFLLYYQFIKHAFGLPVLSSGDHPVKLRLYFDQFPDTEEKASRFKSFLLALFQKNKVYREGNVKVLAEDITEVRSHNHILLQCLDVILGAMNFRLNHKHVIKLPNSTRRGKRTMAKEKLYKHILSEIRVFKSNFNIGISTGRGENPSSLWEDPYRHWSFKPNDQ